MSETNERVGFIGLGNMGKPVADQIARAGFEMHVFDIAGTAERAPAGAHVAASVTEVAERSTAIIVSLPTLESLASVVAEIAGAQCAAGLVVVNTCTSGSAAARSAHAALAAADIGYVDAPVSGGAFGAEQGTLTIMFSGAPALLERLRAVMAPWSANIFNIGPEPGQGQRMKLVNNCLVISAFVNSSMALAYGAKGGIDIETMLDVVNVSTGMNFVTKEYFPRAVLDGSYDSGGANHIIVKDLGLFIEEARGEGLRHEVADVMIEVIEELEALEPGCDQMRLYPLMLDGGRKTAGG